MSNGLTTDGANLALDFVLALVDEVRLLTTNGDADTAGIEVVGGSYVAATGTTFDVAADGMSANASDINIADMPACTVVGAELWDSSGPTRLAYGAVSTPQVFGAGDPAELLIGDMTITLLPTS